MSTNIDIELIRLALLCNKNIAIRGDVRSGKTDYLVALSQAIPKSILIAHTEYKGLVYNIRTNTYSFMEPLASNLLSIDDIDYLFIDDIDLMTKERRNLVMTMYPNVQIIATINSVESEKGDYDAYYDVPDSYKNMIMGWKQIINFPIQLLAFPIDNLAYRKIKSIGVLCTMNDEILGDNYRVPNDTLYIVLGSIVMYTIKESSMYGMVGYVKSISKNEIDVHGIGTVTRFTKEIVINQEIKLISRQFPLYLLKSNDDWIMDGVVQLK